MQMATPSSLNCGRHQFLKRKPPETSKKTTFLVKEKKRKKVYSLINETNPMTEKSCSSNFPSESSPADNNVVPPVALSCSFDSVDSEVLSVGCTPAILSDKEISDLRANISLLNVPQIVDNVALAASSSNVIEENILQIENNSSQKSIIIKTDKTKVAKIDLSNIKQFRDFPHQPDLKQVQISSVDNKLGILSKINPFHIAREINAICGEVANIEHRRSGSILVTTKSTEQAKTLLEIKSFSAKQIPVTVTPDWGSQTVQGKVFVPQFSDDSLEELLEMLKTQGVVGIRKMFLDPRRAESSLYVLTFLGRKCPEKSRSGILLYK